MNRVLVALTIITLAATPALAGGAAGGVVNKGGIVITPNGAKPGSSSAGGSALGGGRSPSIASGQVNGPPVNIGPVGRVSPFGGKGGLSGDVHK
jgi:hypothetical protein